MSELREILKELTFASEDNATKSGKVMDGKSWRKDILKAEKKIKQQALDKIDEVEGLLLANPSISSRSKIGGKIFVAEIRKKIEEGK